MLIKGVENDFLVLTFVCVWLRVWRNNELDVSSTGAWLEEVVGIWKNNNVDEGPAMAQLFFFLWQIWKTCNEFIFNNKQPNPMAALIITKAQCAKFLSA